MNTLRRVILTILLFLFLCPVASYAKTDEVRMLVQAREQYQAGNYYFASTWLERLLKDYPASSQRQEVLELLSKSYASTGRDAKAVVTLRTLLKDYPKVAETLDPKLLKLVESGDPSHTEYSLADVQDAPVEPVQNVPAASAAVPVAPTSVAVPASVAVVASAPVPVVAPVEAKVAPVKKTWWIFGSRAPLEAKSIQPKPAESKPAESKPAESKPAEQKPAEQKYTLDDLAGLAQPAKPFTPRPKDAKLAAATKAAEPKAADPKLAPNTADSKPAESKPAEQKYTLDDLAGLAPPEKPFTPRPKDPKLAAATKAAEPRTADPKLAPNTAESKPAEQKPAEQKPAEQKYTLDDLAGLAPPEKPFTPRPKDPKLAAATKAVGPKAADPKLAPNTAEPKLAAPKPAEPKNSELKQSGLKSAEVKAGEVKPAAPKATVQDYTLDDLKDPMPAEVKVVAPKPTEPKLAAPQPGESKQAAPKSAEPKKETKQPEIKPAPQKTAGPEPAQKAYSLDDLADPTPSGAKVVTKPTDPKPAETKIITPKPVEPKVVEHKVVEPKSAEPKVTPKVVPKTVGPVVKTVAPRPVVAIAVPVTPAAPKSQQKVLKTVAPVPVAVPPKVFPPVAVVNPANSAETTCYTLQIGEYVVQSALGDAKKRVKSLGLEPVVEPGEKRKEPMTRLSLGEYPSQAAAKKGLDKLLAAKTEGFFLLEEDQKYHVYAGSYSDEKGAAKEQQRFAALGLKLSLKQVVVAVPTFLLTAGNFPTREGALAKAEELEKLGVSTRVVERCLLGKRPALPPVRK